MKSLSLIGLIAAISLLSGCSDSGDDGPTNPNNTPVLRAVWQGSEGIGQLFQQKCTPCHISGTSGGYSLADYNSAMQGGRITPNDPDNSVLAQKLSSTPPYPDRMPQGGPYLSTAQLDTIRAWIRNGALNN
jgi:hypothetical protein